MSSCWPSVKGDLSVKSAVRMISLLAGGMCPSEYRDIGGRLGEFRFPVPRCLASVPLYRPALSTMVGCVSFLEITSQSTVEIAVLMGCLFLLWF